MNITLLIGAGASIAEANNRSGSPPPLDKTFFKLCEKEKIFGRVPVKKYLSKYYGIDPFLNNYRMEEIFNYIYSDAFADYSPPGCLEAYWALVRMYTRAISMTTNKLNGNSRTGVGTLIRKLLTKFRGSNISILNYNQDLLIEKALEKTYGMKKYSNVEWNISKTYGINFEKLAPIKHGNKFKDIGSDSIKILKLHGSLNWVYKVRSREDPKNSLRNPKGGLLCVNEQNIRERLSFKSSRRWMSVIPFIVPPIFEKGTKYKNVIGPIWDLAYQTLKKSNKLIVFGYSFPETDYASKSLMRRGFYRNKNIKDVSVIDSNPLIGGKIASLLNVNILNYYKSINDFS